MLIPEVQTRTQQYQKKLKQLKKRNANFILHAKLYANARSTSKNIITLKITKITQNNSKKRNANVMLHAKLHANARNTNKNTTISKITKLTQKTKC